MFGVEPSRDRLGQRPGQHRQASGPGGRQGRLGGAPTVRVPGHRVGVENQQVARLFLGDDLKNVTGELVERYRVEVAAGIMVQLDPGQPKLRRCGLQLLGSDQRQVTRRPVPRRAPAVGEADQAGPHVPNDQLGQDGAELERLVARAGDHGQHSGDTPEQFPAVVVDGRRWVRRHLRIHHTPGGIGVGGGRVGRRPHGHRADQFRKAVRCCCEAASRWVYTCCTSGAVSPLSAACRSAMSAFSTSGPPAVQRPGWRPATLS